MPKTKNNTNKFAAFHIQNSYVNFVYNYLYYIDTAFDQRHDSNPTYTVEGKRSLMLVPSEALNLTRINFYDQDIDYCIYTHSLLDFYARPN